MQVRHVAEHVPGGVAQLVPRHVQVRERGLDGLEEVARHGGDVVVRQVQHLDVGVVELLPLLPARAAQPHLQVEQVVVAHVEAQRGQRAHLVQHGQVQLADGVVGQVQLLQRRQVLEGLGVYLKDTAERRTVSGSLFSSAHAFKNLKKET